ncbi:major facilitator superfamily domain-containing protein [Radiomyces spectabilis]|uniref:major facilitator superfamily domain-containing protein n=1 Tax=Radiomyces spectabilis TaxID=64574 RepID=UPI0022201CE2|nr:major facilitator superfamily domain-containing protein [Radiomyces spectabilis]KAI8380992.1 major facilitator superfamily domain-containing protein [Radiomyces spectabilis]
MRSLKDDDDNQIQSAVDPKPVSNQSTCSSHKLHEDLFSPEELNACDREVTDPESEKDPLMKASIQLKIVILICMLALPVGCHYLEATMGTLKTTLKHKMHINNTEFSILLSSVSLVNTVLPLLAGTFIDDVSHLGSIRATTIVSMVIFIGSLLVSIAGIRNSYPIMITGQIIYGLGGGMIVTMQEGILSRWFRDRQLAIVIGILLCIARLTKWAAKMVCYPIISATGSDVLPIHVATMLCASGVVMNAVYWMIMYKNGWATVTGKEIVQVKAKYRNQFKRTEKDNSSSIITNSFRWSASLFLYIPATFWMVPWVQLIMSSVLSSFDDIATEFVQFRFQTTSIMAGYQSSLTQVVPIVAAPVMGVIVHRFGKRLTSLLFATFVLTASMVCLAYTWAPPAVGMILFSLALALGPVSVLSSTSLLLPHELAGTGMGLHKCANNIGTTIVSVIVGYVQDLTYHDGDPHDDQADLRQEYHGVMIFYLVMAGCSILVVAIFWMMDRKLLNGWLQADKKERDRRLRCVQQLQEEEAKQYRYGPAYESKSTEISAQLQGIGSQLRERKSYVYVSIYSFWLVASWAVFLTFALMPIYQHYS